MANKTKGGMSPYSSLKTPPVQSTRITVAIGKCHCPVHFIHTNLNRGRYHSYLRRWYVVVSVHLASSSWLKWYASACISPEISLSGLDKPVGRSQHRCTHQHLPQFSRDCSTVHTPMTSQVRGLVHLERASDRSGHTNKIDKE